ncbi:GTP-binding protein HflX [Paramesorhizobium deserti]|uniref:GTPase HflX n=1 Tax=Paramesorhizobium deserti TaxID=1494590 RepID=A0A135HVW1_9HYPH|nr:GTPase HflX [Paramesorhizobium deserti]KXF77326.1 GTP-binding protein HflX [Paramesorhizobium deserti]
MSRSKGRTTHEGDADAGFGTSAKGPTRAVVIVPILPERLQDAGQADDVYRPQFRRSNEARLEEAIGLARAIDLDLVYCDVVTVANPRPATLIGSGKVEAIAEIIKREEAELVIVDHALTPVQQRNLEKEWNAKVIDRTGLILEIFGRRAQTKEGALQVELAHLNYQKGRLVRSWTHLERQRGGGGFLGGPGETQIEADRRILQEKILRIRRELETVVRTRTLHRQKRRKVPHPIVALVGYTNAGKSTLFNRLTGSDVLAEDMLFATLDPTLRRIRLPHGETVILSDTVGFISNLPTHLVAAFRATLEEVVEADLILHVRDISDPDNAAQAEDVESILESLDIERGDVRRILEVWNKIDLLDEAGREAALRLSAAAPEDARPIAISAATGEGVDHLLSVIESRISGALEHVELELAPNDLHLLDWIYQHASNIRRNDLEDGSLRIKADMTVSARKTLRERMKNEK